MYLVWYRYVFLLLYVIVAICDGLLRSGDNFRVPRLLPLETVTLSAVVAVVGFRLVDPIFGALEVPPSSLPIAAKWYY